MPVRIHWTVNPFWCRRVYSIDKRWLRRFEGGHGAQLLENILKPFPAVGVSMLMMSMAQVEMASIPEETAALAANRQISNLQGRVRRTPLLPLNNGAFDDLGFALQDDAVPLTGGVRKSISKSEAEAALLKTAEVSRVIDAVAILSSPTI